MKKIIILRNKKIIYNYTTVIKFEGNLKKKTIQNTHFTVANFLLELAKCYL